jgi:photosystem II stability/assembly factor-like uncharacterized protein
MFTTNRGATWGAADTSIPKTAVYSLLTKGADVYVGSSGQGVFRSTDGGVKWFAASSGLNGNARTIWSMATDGSSLFAGTSSGVYRSSNDGGSWTQASQGIPDSVIRQVGAAPGAAYAAVPNLVYRTTDAGLHWTPASSGMPQYFQCNAFVTEDSDMFVGIVGGLYRTTNKGGSWTNVTAGFSSSPDVRALAVYPTGSKVLLAGLARGGVYLSTDRGVTWTFGGTGLASGITVTALSWEQGYLYAGTYSHGVWKRATSEMIVAVGKESAAPGQFELKQNYPNPFNGEATIQYTVGGVGLQASGVSNVQLQVFDLLGREIATLVNERKVPGTYSVSFDAGRLSSGVYLYRFTAGGYVQTRRMVVVK